MPRKIPTVANSFPRRFRPSSQLFQMSRRAKKRLIIVLTRVTTKSAEHGNEEAVAKVRRSCRSISTIPRCPHRSTPFSHSRAILFGIVRGPLGLVTRTSPHQHSREYRYVACVNVIRYPKRNRRDKTDRGSPSQAERAWLLQRGAGTDAALFASTRVFLGTRLLGFYSAKELKNPLISAIP